MNIRISSSQNPVAAPKSQIWNWLRHEKGHASSNAQHNGTNVAVVVFTESTKPLCDSENLSAKTSFIRYENFTQEDNVKSVDGCESPGGRKSSKINSENGSSGNDGKKTSNRSEGIPKRQCDFELPGLEEKPFDYTNMPLEYYCALGLS